MGRSVPEIRAAVSQTPEASRTLRGFKTNPPSSPFQPRPGPGLCIAIATTIAMTMTICSKLLPCPTPVPAA
ncbi:unnamed protein product [Gadus morhua 'NCC']